MRKAALTLLAGAGIAAFACASPGAPPGGPPDKEIPQLRGIFPDSNAVNVRTPAVVLRFDEVISERSSPAGGNAGGASGGLNNLLVLSPSDGRDEVVWRREALELRPRRGFRPNTAYRVTLLPGLVDLRGNRVTEPFSFVFSTGPALPGGRVSGVIFDWTTGRPAANARVEVFTAADTNFRWIARSDSTGRFVVSELNGGAYRLRAWVDANNDRRISLREISDTAQVTLVDTTSLELYAFVRDTLRPRIENVELLDSTAIRVKFDRGIIADWDGSGATLFGPDSLPVALAGPFVPSAVYDSLAKLRKAATDSVTGDSARRAALPPGGEGLAPAPFPPDTVRTDVLRPIPPRRDTATRAAPQRDSLAPAQATRDTTSRDSLPPAPQFRRQVPPMQWTAALAAPLAPGSYRLRIEGAAGLNGRSVEGERELRVRPPAPPKADSSAARSDSTAQRPDSNATGNRPPRLGANTARRP